VGSGLTLYVLKVYIAIPMFTKGHPFMPSTRRGGKGFRLIWMPANGRERVSSMWTSTQKIRAHWRHPGFFSSKEVGVLLDHNFVFRRKKRGIFRQYKLVILVTNSTVLNKSQWYYSRISALGQDGRCHCISCCKRVMCISSWWHVDVHKGRGQAHVDSRKW